jgi:hypothetical protein
MFLLRKNKRPLGWGGRGGDAIVKKRGWGRKNGGRRGRSYEKSARGWGGWIKKGRHGKK